MEIVLEMAESIYSIATRGAAYAHRITTNPCLNQCTMPEPGGGRGSTGPLPIFGRSVNPIPTGEGRLSPPITTSTPNVFHLPASLQIIHHP